MDIVKPLGSILGISVISTLIIGGIFFFQQGKKISLPLNYFVALSVGMLLSNSLLHLLPEAYSESKNDPQIGIACLLGVLVFYAFENFFHWQHEHNPKHVHPVGYMNFVSEAVHKFMDGVIITTTYSLGDSIGTATTIAILVHEIPQRIGSFGVMLNASFSPLKALWFGTIASLFGLGGMLAVYFGHHWLKNFEHLVTPFIAGMFIYIAGTDLMPQLHSHISTQKSILQFLFIIIGMLFIALFASSH